MECDPSLADTATFCAHYNIELSRSANAIVVASRSEPTKYACCIVLATHKLDVNKAVCPLLQVKRCSFATGEQTIELTDMQIGGVTPIGIENIPIYIDAAVMTQESVVLGGGNRLSKVVMDPRELLKLPNASVIEKLALPK